MDSEKGSTGNLKIRLEGVIEKSKAQKEILEKILDQLSKQKKGNNDQPEKRKNNNK